MTVQSEASIKLLLFSFQGVHFGIDTEQALETAPYDGEDAGDLLWLHEELGFASHRAVYHAPTIITVGPREGAQYRVVIDSMEDIAECSLNDIRPLPPLLEPFSLRKGIWGVLQRDGRITLLLDFMSLFSNKVQEDTIA